jgi:hypothetical protein
MPDNHLMLLAIKKTVEIRGNNDPETQAVKLSYDPGISGHLVAVAQNGGLRARGHNKRNRP